jgi:hypothetical protein
MAARERRREQEEATRRSLHLVQQECQAAYDSWVSSSQEQVDTSRPENAWPSSNSWDTWLDHRLAIEREMIWAAVGEAIAQYADVERQSVRNELESRINQIRAEIARDRSADIGAQKTLLTEIREIIAKMRHGGAEDMPGSRMH